MSLLQRLAGSLLLSIIASSALAAKPHLSSQQVLALARSAATKASYNPDFFDWERPLFDSVTRVWSIKFTGRRAEGSHRTMFSVFVYDRTSRSEVTCLGLEALGEMPTQELPPEVQKFIGNDENANALYCADLNGDGLPDYLLVTTTQDHLSGRSMKVLIRRPNGQLDLAVGNTHALQPPSFDGINGAPDLLVRRNKFQILDNSAGSGGSTEHVFYFEFSKPENTWLLTRMDFDIQGAGPDYLHPYSLRPKHTTINDFDMRKYED